MYYVCMQQEKQQQAPQSIFKKKNDFQLFYNQFLIHPYPNDYVVAPQYM